jgi:GxxExxY protein
MPPGELIQERLTHSVIGAFFDVYNELDVGYLECLYAAALERELLARGHRVARELRVAVSYKGEELGFQRLDMVVDDALVVEIKATAKLHADAWRQIRSYLRGTRLEVGLLLHFGRKPAFHRIISTNDKRSA